MRKQIIEWIRSLVIAIVILFIINLFIGTTTVINTSMYPNLQEGDMLLLYKRGSIERGDIVIFKSELTISASDLSHIGPVRRLFIHAGDPKYLIKRVIALPGESISISDGKVYIDGVLLDESTYFLGETTDEISLGPLPEGKYFLMGDNRSVSMDSRTEQVGLIDADAITGKAILRYWPITRFEIFKEVYSK